MSEKSPAVETAGYNSEVALRRLDPIREGGFCERSPMMTRDVFLYDESNGHTLVHSSRSDEPIDVVGALAIFQYSCVGSREGCPEHSLLKGGTRRQARA